MKAFLESEIGQVVARNGVLAIILAWALWSNHTLVERLFVLIENNTRAFEEVRSVLRDGYGRQ